MADGWDSRFEQAFATLHGAPKLPKAAKKAVSSPVSSTQLVLVSTHARNKAHVRAIYFTHMPTHSHTHTQMGCISHRLHCSH